MGILNVLRRFISFLSARRALTKRNFDFLSAAESSIVDVDRIYAEKLCKMTIGPNSVLRGDVYLERAGSKLSIGARCFVASPCFCASEITIEDDVMVSASGAIFDHDSHSLDFQLRANDVIDWIDKKKNWASVPCESVRICSKAWIGFSVIILKGVQIGEGAVVGAGSVVTKSVAPWTLVAGNPARPIRELSRRS